jgi:hypothetical protein
LRDESADINLADAIGNTLATAQRREAHHVKTRKGYYSYSLQGNLPPSVINDSMRKQSAKPP